MKWFFSESGRDAGGFLYLLHRQNVPVANLLATQFGQYAQHRFLRQVHRRCIVTVTRHNKLPNVPLTHRYADLYHLIGRGSNDGKLPTSARATKADVIVPRKVKHPVSRCNSRFGTTNSVLHFSAIRLWCQLSVWAFVHAEGARLEVVFFLNFLHLVLSAVYQRLSRVQTVF